MSWHRSNFACYAVEFSPFNPNLYALASAQYYGIVGNGKVSVFRTDQGTGSVPTFEVLTQDGAYDVAWSEERENVLCAGCGDGTVKIFDMNAPNRCVFSSLEHTAEVYGVAWNANLRNLVVSASWDSSSIVWDCAQGGLRPIRRYPGLHQGKVGYSAVWSPHRANVFASVGGDGKLNIVDAGEPSGGKGVKLSIQAHQYECLSVDWMKYTDTQLVTGSVDKQIRVWDVRQLREPFKVMFGHQLAVRRVKSHPHQANLVGSCSYDMSVKLWDVAGGGMVRSRCTTS